MLVIFYSEKCKYCIKLLQYIYKNNISNYFKLIDVNKNDIPEFINIIPTIINTEFNKPIIGRAVFEFLLNLKYFGIPTNNIEYNKFIPDKLNIKEDSLNTNDDISNINDHYKEEILDFYNDINKTETKIKIEPISSKKLGLLMKMKRK